MDSVTHAHVYSANTFVKLQTDNTIVDQSYTPTLITPMTPLFTALSPQQPYRDYKICTSLNGGKVSGTWTSIPINAASCPLQEAGSPPLISTRCLNKHSSQWHQQSSWTPPFNMTPDGTSISTTSLRRLAFLRRNLKICAINTKQLVYKSLVRLLLKYASTVWDPHIKKDTSRIEMLQRRAACFVLQDYTQMFDDMTGRLNWPILEHRRYVARLTMFYEVVNRLAATSCCWCCSPELQHQATRWRRAHNRTYRQYTRRTDHNTWRTGMPSPKRQSMPLPLTPP